MGDIIRIDGELVGADPPDRNPALVYLAGLAESGRRTMASKLTTVAQLLGFVDFRAVPWHELRHQHLVAIRTRLQEADYAPSTVNTVIYAIRGVMNAAFNLRMIDADELARIKAVKPVRGQRLPAGRAITSGELAALMNECAADPGPAGVRDAAGIGLMYAAGLRRSELVALDADSYDPETGEIVVMGKGDKQRTVFINDGAADALSDWLLILDRESGPMFVAIDKGGTIHREDRLSDQAVYSMLRRRANRAGVKPLSPHDLRRSFVSDLLAAGADLSVASRMAGHSQVQTTARYDRRDDGAKREAAGLLHLPYRRRERLPLGEPEEDPDDRS